MQGYQEEAAHGSTLQDIFKPIKRDQVLAGFYQLEKLLGVGVSLVDALDDVASAERKAKAASCWRAIANDVRSGLRFSEALGKVPIGLDRTSLALVQTGEINGHLDKACASLHTHLQWHSDVRKRMVTVLVYPVFSLLVSLLVVGFLFVSVVPSIENFLISSNADLLWHTQWLINVSAWIRFTYQEATLVVCLTLVGAGVVYRVSEKVREKIDLALLAIPLLGDVFLELSLSRYAHCVAQLYNAGIALESTLQISEKLVANRCIRYQLMGARQSIVNGDSFADSLQLQPVFPSIYVRMVRVGEDSGQLVTVLEQLARQLQKDADATLSRLEQLIAPALMLSIGSVLLWIVISALSPVYNMAIATAIGFS